VWQVPVLDEVVVECSSNLKEKDKAKPSRT